MMLEPTLSGHNWQSGPITERTGGVPRCLFNWWTSGQERPSKKYPSRLGVELQDSLTQFNFRHACAVWKSEVCKSRAQVDFYWGRLGNNSKYPDDRLVQWAIQPAVDIGGIAVHLISQEIIIWAILKNWREWHLSWGRTLPTHNSAMSISRAPWGYVCTGTRVSGLPVKIDRFSPLSKPDFPSPAPKNRTMRLSPPIPDTDRPPAWGPTSRWIWVTDATHLRGMNKRCNLDPNVILRPTKDGRELNRDPYKQKRCRRCMQGGRSGHSGSGTPEFVSVESSRERERGTFQSSSAAERRWEWIERTGRFKIESLKQWET